LAVGRRLIVWVNMNAKRGEGREKGSTERAQPWRGDLITHNVKQNTIKHTPNATIFRLPSSFYAVIL